MSSSLLPVIEAGNTITCGATDITWFYEGIDTSLSLTVTNIGVPQGSPPPTTTGHLTPIGAGTPILNGRASPTSITPTPTSHVIATDIDSNAFGFVWNPVAVQSGWYIIVASLLEQGSTVNSSAFFVKDSTDTSCLSLGTSPSTALPPASSTGSTTPTQTVVMTTTARQSATATPVAVAGSSGLSKGAIAGIALGAIILALGWAAAWWLFFRRGRRTSKSQRPDGTKQLRHRSALASMDSTSGLMGKTARNPFGSRRPSMGTIPLSPSFDGAGLEKGSIHSAYHPSFQDGLRIIDHTQLPPSQGGRRYSRSSFDLPPLNFSGNASRRPSQADSAYGRQSSDSTTYPPTSPQLSGPNMTPFAPLTRSHSLSTHSGLPCQTSSPPSAAPSPSPYSMPEASSPDSPSSPSDHANVTKRVRRQSVGNKKRKPVPMYDPDSEDLAPTPLSPSPVPPSSSPSPVPPPSPTPPLVGPSYAPHYSTRNRSQPELTHKSSFGPGGLEGKQLHYLMPDMPPPSRS